MIELTFLKELILIRQANQKSVLKSEGSYDLLMISINLCDIATLNIKSDDYLCIVSGISKSEAINLIQNTYLSKKGGDYKYPQQFEAIDLLEVLIFFKKE